MSEHFSVGKLLRFTAPSILGSLFGSLYSIVDGLFVANFAGTISFAAINFTFPLLLMLGTIGFMFGAGGCAVVAKARGEGDEERANGYFSLIVYTVLVAGIILSIAGFFLLRPILQLLGGTGEMLDLAVVYGRISMISLTFFMLQYTLIGFFSAAGKPKMGFYVTLAAGITNIALDVIMVGILKWGVVGAAIATVTSEYVAGGIPLLFFARKNDTPLRIGKPFGGARILGKVCVNGSSEMVSNIAMSLMGLLYNMQLIRFAGEIGVAAWGVAGYAGAMFGSILMGYSMSSAPLMSFQYGAQNHREMRSLLKKGLAIVGIGGLLATLLAEVFSVPLCSIFVSKDPETLQMSIHGLRIIALSFVLSGFNAYGSAFFTSLENGLISAIISFLRTMVFEFAAIFTLPIFFGLDGLWFGMPTAELACIILTIAFFCKYARHYGFVGPLEQTEPQGEEPGEETLAG